MLMTLMDLLKLIKHNLKLIVLLPVACAVVTGVVCFFIPSSYSATASFVTNVDIAMAQGFATSAAAGNSISGISVDVSSSATTKQISVTAKGADGDRCISAANSVADAAAKQITSAYPDATITENKANYATDSSPSLPKTMLIALVAGLFAAICIVVIHDMIKAPLKSKEDVTGACDLPILADVPTVDDGERLLANLFFRCDKIPASIAIVPIGTTDSGSIVANELARALDRTGVHVNLVQGVAHARRFKVNIPDNTVIIVDCRPLSEGMGAAYIAHEAEATILCVSEWTSSKPQLCSTYEELTLAKANIAGIAYFSWDKRK